MNNNARIAKELVRIAKSIVAGGGITQGAQFSAGIGKKNDWIAIEIRFGGLNKQWFDFNTFINVIKQHSKAVNEKCKKIIELAKADGFDLSMASDKKAKSIMQYNDNILIDYYLYASYDGEIPSREQCEKWLKAAGIDNIED